MIGSETFIIGHVVRAFLPEVFARFGAHLEAAGLSPNNGLGSILAGLDKLPEDVRDDVRAAIEKGLADGPRLAMVNSDKGITNLHVPSDVIVDASMPAMIRTSGHMWGPDGEEHDTDGLTLKIMSPVEAAKFSVGRIRRGEDTISVTGNVLRDYNTDLFPILELGTSA